MDFGNLHIDSFSYATEWFINASNIKKIRINLDK